MVKKSIDKTYLLVFCVCVAVVLIFKAQFEIFKIPSESMMPTVLPGDYILMNEFRYGLRLPDSKIWLLRWGQPQRGDVVVFRKPTQQINMVKRIVGIPGDQVHVDSSTQQVTINGHTLPWIKFEVQGRNDNDHCVAKTSDEFQNQILKNFPYSSKHQKYHYALEQNQDDSFHLVQILKETKVSEMPESFEVPPDSYFVLGDNRDQSHDSRFWGFVPLQNIYGEATHVVWSFGRSNLNCKSVWGGKTHLIRWNRTLRSIQ